MCRLLHYIYEDCIFFYLEREELIREGDFAIYFMTDYPSNFGMYYHVLYCSFAFETPQELTR